MGQIFGTEAQEQQRQNKLTIASVLDENAACRFQTTFEQILINHDQECKEY